VEIMPQLILKGLCWTGAALIALAIAFPTRPLSNGPWYFIAAFVFFLLIGEEIHKYKRQQRHREHAIAAELRAVLAHLEEKQKEAFAEPEWLLSPMPKRSPSMRSVSPPLRRQVPQRRVSVLAVGPRWCGKPIEWITFSIMNFAARILMRGRFLSS
jgi:hypothetical protein